MADPAANHRRTQADFKNLGAVGHVFRLFSSWVRLLESSCIAWQTFDFQRANYLRQGGQVNNIFSEQRLEIVNFSVGWNSGWAPGQPRVAMDYSSDQMSESFQGWSLGWWRRWRNHPVFWCFMEDIATDDSGLISTVKSKTCGDTYHVFIGCASIHSMINL